MILQISLSNFFSIKDEVVLDLEQSNRRLPEKIRLQDNAFKENGYSLLKSIAIFGANASGKSNFLRALSACVTLITESHNRTGASVPLFNTFKFDEEENPSKFEIEFIVEGEKYVYGFSIFHNIVKEEHLFAFPKGYRATIFQRDTEDGITSYKYAKNFIRPKEVSSNTSPYTLFLSRSAQMNREVAVKIVRFFKNRFMLGLPKTELSLAPLLDHKDLIMEGLRRADSDIIDYELQDEPRGNRQKLVTFHKFDPKKGFDFFREESAGTRRLLALLLALIEVVEYDKILILDELESSLHTQLVSYIVELFNSSRKAQMIFTTHDINLLDSGLLRPDQIYFVCKRDTDGSTELYSLNDFEDYKNFDHLRQDYLLGRFNAVPIIDDTTFSLPQNES
ncbi:MAG: ATP-binding protein [Bacteroidales bacterium]|nr:ATP-binding protein [Bacteroidales bacterium]